MPLAPNVRLGTYEIVGPIGAGGMGEVYRARDLRLNREIAIKVLPQDVADSPERLDRFEREARTVAALNHPNIVTLHSVEDEDGIRFITMELVEGVSLAALIASGPLPASRVLDIGVPIAEALAAAHKRGVVHRDLKPANVMVTHEGSVKLLDFGLAKPAGSRLAEAAVTNAAPTDVTVSAEGIMSGTVPYMAPEQIQRHGVDARSDLFALGVMLFEMATGQRPFQGRTYEAVAQAILKETPAPVTRLRPNYPATFDKIVARCLAKDPRERFHAAIEVRDELARLRGPGSLRGGLGGPGETASIAVIPFVNRSRDEADEYFSDGLADELLTTLSKIRGLRVAARSSAFHFKNRPATVAEIGQALGVATVLEGSVRKAGNRVRVSAHLVKVADGFQLWSETYDRALHDIFAVQDDIAGTVVKELRTALLGEAPDSSTGGLLRDEVGKAARGRAMNAEAHRLYLLGRYFMEQLSRAGTDKGIVYIKEALALEPDFALGWSTLALAYLRGANSGWASITESVESARAAVGRALALVPDLGEAHATLARLQLVYDRDAPRAEASIQRALELEPGSPAVLRAWAETARNLGRHEEAVDAARRALEQDPLSATSHNIVGLVSGSSGRLAEAEAAFRRALELTPGRIGTWAGLSCVLVQLGRTEEALSTVAREPDEAYRLWAQTIVEHAAGRRADSDATLATLIRGYADDSAYQIAEAYAARGEADAAFTWLERAHAQQDGGLVTELTSSLPFVPLHADPRWVPFVHKVWPGGPPVVALKATAK